MIFKRSQMVMCRPSSEIRGLMWIVECDGPAAERVDAVGQLLLRVAVPRLARGDARHFGRRRQQGRRGCRVNP